MIEQISGIDTSVLPPFYAECALPEKVHVRQPRLRERKVYPVLYAAKAIISFASGQGGFICGHVTAMSSKSLAFRFSVAEGEQAPVLGKSDITLAIEWPVERDGKVLNLFVQGRVEACWDQAVEVVFNRFCFAERSMTWEPPIKG